MSETSSPRHGGRVGSVIKGKWQVDARIGAGGMATVYSATHRNNGLRVALKMLHSQLSRDTDIRTRFLREAYVANAIDHPNICRVLDDDVTEDGSAFLVLELLEGESVESRRLARGGTIPVEEALDIADQALDALAAAHEKGIVHRDVKPDNVFITHAGVVKLLDFGLARMKDKTAEATKTGVTIGTPEFMPPEQALGRRDDVDARSDVWGLGATLFTAISGKYVHDANTLHEQLMASATQRARSLKSVVPDIHPLVAAVVDRALELEQEDRWQGAREMQRALRRARSGDDADLFSSDSLTVRKVPSSHPISATSPPKTPSSDDKTIAIIGRIPTGPQTPQTIEAISRRFEEALGRGKGFPEQETMLDLGPPPSGPSMRDPSSLPLSSGPPTTPAVITERLGYSPRAQQAAPPAAPYQTPRPMPHATTSPSGGVPIVESGPSSLQQHTAPLNYRQIQQLTPAPVMSPSGAHAIAAPPSARPAKTARSILIILVVMIALSAAASTYLLWRGGHLF